MIPDSLNCHRHFSKYANVVPLTNTDGKSVLSALKDSFKIMGHPMSIYSDDDGGFKTVVKEYFEAEGITHIITLTHANVAERFIRTIKNMIYERVRFNRAGWTSMLTPALKRYNETVHSSTKMTPKEAHDDKNHMNVRENLTRREKNTRKYPEVGVNDTEKIFSKGGGNYVRLTAVGLKRHTKLKRLNMTKLPTRLSDYEV